MSLKITEFQSASSISGEELLAIVQGDENRKIDMDSAYPAKLFDTWQPDSALVLTSIPSVNNSWVPGWNSVTITPPNGISQVSDGATGDFSVSLGHSGAASGLQSIGINGEAIHNYSIAIGGNATKINSISIGANSTTRGDGDIVIGESSSTVGLSASEGAIAIGQYVRNTGASSMVIGSQGWNSTDNIAEIGLWSDDSPNTLTKRDAALRMYRTGQSVLSLQTGVSSAYISSSGDNGGEESDELFADSGSYSVREYEGGLHIDFSDGITDNTSQIVPAPINSLEDLYSLIGLVGGERYELPDGTIMRYRGALSDYQAQHIDAPTASHNGVELSGYYQPDSKGNYINTVTGSFIEDYGGVYYIWSTTEASGMEGFASDDYPATPAEVSGWTANSGSGTISADDVTSAPEMTESNWINKTSNTIVVTTNEAKNLLTDIADGVQIEVTQEASRIERFNPTVDGAPRSIVVKTDAIDALGQNYTGIYDYNSTTLSYFKREPNSSNQFIYYASGTWSLSADVSNPIKAPATPQSTFPADIIGDWNEVGGSEVVLADEVTAPPAATEKNWAILVGSHELIIREATGVGLVVDGANVNALTTTNIGWKRHGAKITIKNASGDLALEEYEGGFIGDFTSGVTLNTPYCIPVVPITSKSITLVHDLF